MEHNQLKRSKRFELVEGESFKHQKTQTAPKPWSPHTFTTTTSQASPTTTRMSATVQPLSTCQPKEQLKWDMLFVVFMITNIFYWKKCHQRNGAASTSSSSIIQIWAGKSQKILHPRTYHDFNKPYVSPINTFRTNERMPLYVLSSSSSSSSSLQVFVWRVIMRVGKYSQAKWNSEMRNCPPCHSFPLATHYILPILEHSKLQSERVLISSGNFAVTFNGLSCVSQGGQGTKLIHPSPFSIFMGEHIRHTHSISLDYVTVSVLPDVT